MPEKPDLVILKITSPLQVFKGTKHSPSNNKQNNERNFNNWAAGNATLTILPDLSYAIDDETEKNRHKTAGGEKKRRK